MFCKVCGKEINENAVVCPHCGCGVAQAQKSTSVAAVVGFIMSLVSLFISFYCIIPVLGVVFSGIGMSATSYGKKKGRGIAVAGLVISIISLVLNIIILATVGSMLALIS
ncbi:MAG: hypothetical protein J6B04_02675 [Clostridia bacterium]|nr:hypothetical protein [Clostridia bacterium]